MGERAGATGVNHPWPTVYMSEARYTEPRADCPTPEWWHSTDDDSTEREVSDLLFGLVRALQPDLVVETGCAWGQTSYELGRALAANSHGRLLTCDPDPTRAAATGARCAGLPVDVLLGNSDQLLRGLESVHQPARRVGLAWLDSLLYLRAGELRRLAPLLAPGAVVGVHDTGPHRQETHHAVLDAAAHLGLRPGLQLHTPRGCTLLQAPPDPAWWPR